MIGRLFRGLVVVAMLVCLGGCARTPGGAAVNRRLIDLSMTIRGTFDQNAYYLFVFDTNGRSTNGPEIIAPLTPFTGNGRATGSYTHYVEYHQGRFELFKDQPEQQGTTPPPRVALGQPFAFDGTSLPNTISCTLDLNQLRTSASVAPPTQLEVNYITVNEIVLPGETPPEPRQSDGLGLNGNQYITARLQNGLTVRNDGLETSGEVFGGRTLEPAYDLVDFWLAVRDGS